MQLGPEAGRGGHPKAAALNDAKKVAMAQALYNDKKNSIPDICKTLRCLALDALPLHHREPLATVGNCANRWSRQIPIKEPRHFSIKVTAEIVECGSGKRDYRHRSRTGVGI